ncbi:MAG: Carbamoyl-phosphate synthase small chain [Alphaproteobacteria bacterium MarineAlpha5_Bin9]|nr:MAG: Carbamoyl-phosphate synthase small chain [Alphaproteobacteria bacterium MarineAlpha5_Bin9]|tara:strand:- start:5083 stop:6264 length:1182 start_codon:yes stop_codon:yes gene_type:complete
MLDKKDKESTLNKPTAALLLENGEILFGKGIGSKTNTIGELCFNTSQTGYEEILTDPSYAKQIITFTFPHIGIVGTNKLDLESSKIHACGCIINQEIKNFSNWRGQKSLDFFLSKNNITCISNIDTRYLTRLLAKKGAIKAAIINIENNNKFNFFKKEIKKWKGLKNLDLAKIVTTTSNYKSNESIWDIKKNKYLVNNNKKRHIIACLDYGIKKNIIRCLNNNNFECHILKADASFKEIMSIKPKGIFLSNGPGDPFATSLYVKKTLNKLIKNKIPIFGICLGHQLISIALGCKTKKMFQGHRGANHPVKNIKTGKVEITSQNHGFEVDKSSFPKNIMETHTSLFDGTNEGIKHKYLPVFSVQYHPEASPGPHDSHYLFKEFKKLVEKYAKKK